MRFLIIPRHGIDETKGKTDQPSCDPEKVAFDEKLFTAYMKYNEEMMKAGVLVASEGLNPSEKAVQIGVSGGIRAVIDGPFIETKELVGGFYLIDVKSKAEAIEWALRCPIGLGHEVLEIRQLTELSDLPTELQEMIRTGAPDWSSSRYPAR